MQQNMTETEMRKSILVKLMFSQEIKYGELQKITDNHELFNYHLKELVAKGYVAKNNSIYSLTETGKQQVALMEEDGERQKQFKVGMFINIVRKQDNKYQMLLYKRLKHPHFGYSGAVTGKLKWGDSLKENLARELDEELKIVPTQFKNIGVVRETFLNEMGEKVNDGVFFVFAVTKWEGTPAEKSEEGEYYWHDIDNILNLKKIFRLGFERGLPYLEKYLKEPESFSQYILENGEDKLGF
jgi:ADP-ribose pyrophosphatase YjhB (NUDIX family)